MVVGDSPRSDINPATQIGVKQCILIDSHSKWSIQQENVNSSVIRVKNLVELIEIGTEKL